MIHWDWVVTIWLVSFGTSIFFGVWTLFTEPAKADRMRAEAALIEIKMRESGRLFTCSCGSARERFGHLGDCSAGLGGKPGNATR